MSSYLKVSQTRSKLLKMLAKSKNFPSKNNNNNAGKKKN